jgi:type IV pilus assembly protein PilC
MAQYKYEGRTRNGKKEQGKLIAASRREAMQKLKAKGIAVSLIEEKAVRFWEQEISLGSNVKLQDLCIYLRQFSTLLQAGISIVEANRILASQAENKILRKSLEAIDEDLRSGQPLSEATSKHGKIFPKIYLSMIQAGEISGRLDETLNRVADFFEKQYRTRQKVVSALTYPAILGFIAIVAVIFLLTFVVPTFASMFQGFGARLPAITRYVLNASDWMKKYWWTFVLVVFIIYGTKVILSRISSSKYYIDYAKLRLPIFGKLLQKAAIARMARTLSSLFSSSVPILQAISIVEQIVENEVMARVLKDSRFSLEKGQPLVEPMRSHWAFPPLVTQMIGVGESTGSLDIMLGKIADYYEAEVDTMTDRLKSLIEPIMILLLSVVVGTIVSAIMVPMYDIFNHVHA